MRIDALALALLLVTASFPAYAENPCAIADDTATELQLANSDSGLSGTGRNGGDESGIGGTGRSGKDESGLGGTGFSGDDESGIGGTGIYGTITAFGSICVNGLRVHYDETTPVEEDGEASSATALDVGMVVAIEANGQGAELEASRVSIQSVLVGEVASVDRESGNFTVMGQRVTVNGNSDFEIEVGSRVAISGLRRGDGTVEASRVGERGAKQRDGVSGIARWVDDGVLDVGGVRVRAEKASLPDLEDGQFVRATGAWNAERSTIESATVSGKPAFSDASARLSIEGFVQNLPGDERAWISGVEIDRASLERVIAHPDVPDRVRVSGVRDRAGRLRIERVERINRPHRMGAIKKARPIKIDRRKKPVKPSKANTKMERPRRPKLDRPTDRPERPARPPRPPRPEPPDRSILIDRTLDKSDVRG